MYAKVLNPATNGRQVYANTGSARRATNYLAKEVKAAGAEVVFFGAPGSAPRTAEEVVELLDHNHKGLGKDAAKFYALVLSPSADELTNMGNSPTALTQYTQQVMELYTHLFRACLGFKLDIID